MFNNSGTEAKHNITLPLNGSSGIKGSVDGSECYAETQVRVEIFGVGSTNVTYIQGRIRNSVNWYEIATITGGSNAVYDISTYDFIRYIVLVADGVGTLVSSGFFFNTASSAASSAGEGLLIGVAYDDVQATYPTATTEQYNYLLSGILQATLEVTYTSSTKDIFLRARKTYGI